MIPPEDSRDDKPLAEPSEMICPVCLRNNAPEAAFCAVCGAPLGAVANIDPIQQIQSEGFAFRSAVSGPPRGLILVGTWLVMLPMAGSSLALLSGESAFPMRVFGIVTLLLSLGVMLRVTANYIARKYAERRARRNLPPQSGPVA